MRTDIQFLRGIAVLLVVIYHSGLGLFQHGYLGVDVFFVISGFLITKLILVQLDKGTFSFGDFYFRRAKRLLPALYSTLLFTSALSVIFLTQDQLKDFAYQFIGALSFSANMVLPSQTGYFSEAAESKPLLHIWSLSLEEQYYFILPLFLFLLTKRFRLIGLILAFALSAAMCFQWMVSPHQDPPLLWRLSDATKYEWAFYLLPTRAWELLAGSICAWVYISGRAITLPYSFQSICILTILFFSTFNITPTHPNIEAVSIVAAVSLLLINKGPWIKSNILMRAVEKVGDWSYSIYLVHWPLFAFAHASFIGQVPTSVSMFLIVASIVVGYLQFRFVETPFRYETLCQCFTYWKPLLIITAMITLIPFALFTHPLYGDYADKISTIKKANHGLSSACEHLFERDGHMSAECKTSSVVDTVIWGDSFAMHLSEGLKERNKNLAQITKSFCGPFKEIAPVSGAYNEVWAEGCINFNRKALEYIKNNSTVKTVIMSSSLSNYLGEGIMLTGDGLQERDALFLIESARKTIFELNNAGKQVIFVSPTPQNGRNIAECLERKFGPVAIFYPRCTIDIEDYKQDQKQELAALAAFEQFASVFHLNKLLCNKVECTTQINGVFLYRDYGHFSIMGSKTVLGDIEVKDLVKSDYIKTLEWRALKD